MPNSTIVQGDRFVAEMLLAQVQALQGEIAGVRLAEDPECLHRMRVASRRLRNMLDLFAPWLPAKTLPDWVKAVRRVTRALGAARDLDVQLLFISDFRDSLSDVRLRYGLSRLLLRLQQQRARRQPRVLDILDELERGRMTGALEQHLRQMRVKAQLHPEEDTLQPLLTVAKATITDRLTEMMSYEIFLDSPPNAANQYVMLHAMRIAAKHLRYSMTVFAPLYEGSLQEPLKAARTIQDHLGNLHDCDVWIAALPQFLIDEHQRMLDYTGSERGMSRIVAGISALLDDRIEARARLLKAFQQYWRAIEEQGVWRQLLDSIAGDNG